MENYKVRRKHTLIENLIVETLFCLKISLQHLAYVVRTPKSPSQGRIYVARTMSIVSQKKFLQQIVLKRRQSACFDETNKF